MTSGYNQDKHRQALVDWVNATGKKSTAFDFTTKGILQEACRLTQFWRLRLRHKLAGCSVSLGVGCDIMGRRLVASQHCPSIEISQDIQPLDPSWMGLRGNDLKRSRMHRNC